MAFDYFVESNFYQIINVLNETDKGVACIK